MRSIRSREDIEEAICTLPDAGWVRLRRIAAACCPGRPQDAEELLQEAFARTLAGSRQCPVDVDVIAFLAETIHGIASDAAKSLARHPERQAIALMTDDGLAVDLPDVRPNAEKALESDDEVKRVTREILALFEDDPVAQLMVEGIIEGMEGEELRELVDLTKIAFASKRRLIRRRLKPVTMGEDCAAMTDSADKKREVLARLSKAMIEDILAASDERILAETREDGQDSAAIAAATRAVFEKAVAASGKVLLAAAKAQVSADRQRSATVVPLDPAAARERLARLLAQEPKFTMAARKAMSGELTDDEVFGLLEDLEELGIKPKDSDGGS